MIRPINQKDNKSIHDIIVNVMIEFDADPETTVLADDSIKDMNEFFLSFTAEGWEDIHAFHSWLFNENIVNPLQFLLRAFPVC